MADQEPGNRGGGGSENLGFTAFPVSSFLSLGENPQVSADVLSLKAAGVTKTRALTPRKARTQPLSKPGQCLDVLLKTLGWDPFPWGPQVQ